MVETERRDGDPDPEDEKEDREGGDREDDLLMDDDSRDGESETRSEDDGKFSTFEGNAEILEAEDQDMVDEMESGDWDGPDESDLDIYGDP